MEPLPPGIVPKFPSNYPMKRQLKVLPNPHPNELMSMGLPSTFGAPRQKPGYGGYEYCNEFGGASNIDAENSQGETEYDCDEEQWPNGVCYRDTTTAISNSQSNGWEYGQYTCAAPAPRNKDHYYNLAPNASDYNWDEDRSPKPKKKRFQRNSYNLKMRYGERFCESCDVGFYSMEEYEKHLASHYKCKFNNCSFVGNIEALDNHITYCHLLAPNNITSEGLKNYVSMRKKNFPRSEIVEIKQAMRAQQQKRGELIGLPKNAKKGDQNKQTHFESHKEKRNGHKQNKMFKKATDAKIPFTRTLYEVSTLSKPEPFKGIPELADDQMEKPEALSINSSPESDIKKDDRFHISDEEDYWDDETTKTKGDTVLKTCEQTVALPVCIATTVSAPSVSVTATVAAPSVGIPTTVAAPSVGIPTTVAAPLVNGALGSLICDYASDFEDSDGEECKGNQEDLTEQKIPEDCNSGPIESSIDANRPEMNEQKSSHKKRVRTHKRGSKNKYESTDCVNRSQADIEKNSSTSIVCIPSIEPADSIDSEAVVMLRNREQQLTDLCLKRKKQQFNRKYKKHLLVQLLDREVTHERNVLLQCARYIVNNNYFIKHETRTVGPSIVELSSSSNEDSNCNKTSNENEVANASSKLNKTDKVLIQCAKYTVQNNFFCDKS